MLVAELMTKETACVGPEVPLSEAARLMWDCDCGSLPVVSDQGKVCGMITDRDICMATWLRDNRPTMLPVSGAMSHRLYYCLPTDTLSTAEGLMRAKQVRRVPVLDEAGRLVGILSLADIIKETRYGSTVGLLPNELIATLAEICRTPLSAPHANA